MHDPRPLRRVARPDFAQAKPRDVFVGRAREMDRLMTAYEAVVGGQIGVALIAGEAGIGKTRLVNEFVSAAGRKGALALIGRCSENSDAPALRPWGQVIEACLQHGEGRPKAAGEHADAAQIAEVLPELRGALGVHSRSDYVEPRRSRFRVFDSIARLLAAAASRRPLVVVIEDMHAADAACLQLFEFIAHESRSARVLLVGTYRDAEIKQHGPLTKLLARIHGAARFEHLALPPIRDEDALRLAANLTGDRVGHETLRAAVERAEGNPLFVVELSRTLLDTCRSEQTHTANDTSGDAANGANDVPSGIRAVIERRLARLSAGSVRLLEAAAAIGREFELRELEAVSTNDRLAVLRALDSAVRRRLLMCASDGSARYRFSHALVRECLYARLGLSDRAHLHARIGTTLEKLHRDDLARHLPEIADHLARGALAGNPSLALSYSMRAARAARARQAHEESVRHYLRGLDMWSLCPDGSEAVKCELLIGIGEAHQCAGDPEEARRWFTEAVDVATRLGERRDPHAPRLLAQAALGVAEIWGVMGVFDGALVRLLEDAARGLPETDPLRARVLARTAAAYYWSRETTRRDELSQEALTIARNADDTEALAYAMYARLFAMYGPDRLAEQLVLSDEAIRLGETRGHAEIALTGRYWRFMDFLWLGDNEGARRELRLYTALADKVRHPHYRSNATMPAAMFAMLEGRLDEGQRLAFEALGLARQGNNQNGEMYFAIQMLMLARLQGTEESVLEPAREFVERVPEIPAWRAALASIYAVLGREREARAELERLAEHGFSDLPRDANYLVACALITETCARLHDRRLSQLAHEAMLPYAHCCVIVGTAAGHFGTVSHYLAISAAAAGRAHAAETWFAEALACYETMRARPMIARVLVERAANAISMSGAARRKETADMLTRGRALAAELGMPRWREEADKWRAIVEGELAEPVVATRSQGEVAATASGECSMRHEGAYWSMLYDGRVVRLKDVKGVHYLAELLRSPGRHLDAVELAALFGPANTAERRTTHDADLHAATASSDAILDARAKMEYRRRIAELRADIAEAEDCGDAGRAAGYRRELEQLQQQLALALGLNGRDRRAGSFGERARLNVTRAIRSTIGVIATSHPPLARHLSANVKTGRLCCYEPPESERVDWTF